MRFCRQAEARRFNHKAAKYTKGIKKYELGRRDVWMVEDGMLQINRLSRWTKWSRI